MDETCIIQKWISKREYLFRMFGEFRPTYGGVKVQESRMRENFMYGLKRGQGKRSDGRLERDTLLKEEKHLGSHDLYTTAPLSYSTAVLKRRSGNRDHHMTSRPMGSCAVETHRLL